MDAGHEVAVVVSAMSGTTNQLIGWASDIGALHDAREYDTVVATGEQVTVGLLAIALQNSHRESSLPHVLCVECLPLSVSFARHEDGWRRAVRSSEETD